MPYWVVMLWFRCDLGRYKYVFSPLVIWAANLVDMGTGTGEWAMEVADQFPGARIYGLDLSPIQPNIIPRNAQFILKDISEPLDFDTGQTDLVQSRFIPI